MCWASAWPWLLLLFLLSLCLSSNIRSWLWTASVTSSLYLSSVCPVFSKYSKGSSWGKQRRQRGRRPGHCTEYSAHVFNVKTSPAGSYPIFPQSTWAPCPKRWYFLWIQVTGCSAESFGFDNDMYRHYVPFGFQPNYINLAKITGLAKIKFDIEGSNVSEYSINRKVITFTLDKRKTHFSFSVWDFS